MCNCTEQKSLSLPLSISFRHLYNLLNTRLKHYNNRKEKNIEAFCEKMNTKNHWRHVDKKDDDLNSILAENTKESLKHKFINIAIKQ